MQIWILFGWAGAKILHFLQLRGQGVGAGDAEATSWSSRC